MSPETVVVMSNSEKGDGKTGRRKRWGKWVAHEEER